MARFARLHLHKEEFAFSAGHFTIFSATEREHLHGHNYYVSVTFHIKIEQNGLAFDYRIYKKKIQQLCDQVDRKFLLPANSPYLKLEEQNDYWIGHFNQQKLPFLKSDAIILPLSNITIEELSEWFLQGLLKEEETLKMNGILGLEVNVYNGPGQSAGALWGET